MTPCPFWALLTAGWARPTSLSPTLLLLLLLLLYQLLLILMLFMQLLLVTLDLLLPLESLLLFPLLLLQLPLSPLLFFLLPLKRLFCKPAPPQGAPQDEDEDEDVAAERLAVESAIKKRYTQSSTDAPEPNPIECLSLRKVYPGGKVAVRNQTFSVHHDECFGLLGPNVRARAFECSPHLQSLNCHHCGAQCH